MGCPQLLVYTRATRRSSNVRSVESASPTLYALAIKRVRLQDAVKRLEDAERKRLEAISRAHEEEQERLREEERRQAAIKALQNELEE